MHATAGRTACSSNLRPTDAATEVTQGRGLAWSASGVGVSSGQYHHGKYMMGFAFTDLNRDGDPDLVGAGQHSAIGYALTQRVGTSYRFSPMRWFDDQALAVLLAVLLAVAVEISGRHRHRDETTAAAAVRRAMARRASLAFRDARGATQRASGASSGTSDDEHVTSRLP